MTPDRNQSLEVGEEADESVLLSFRQMIAELADSGLRLEDPILGHAMTVETLKLDMPVELGVNVDEGGQLQLRGAPPTQSIATTIMPVFHRLRLQVTREDEG